LNPSRPGFERRFSGEAPASPGLHPRGIIRPMYIRSREEAIEAMGAILELPGRSQQIVQATVKIAVCMDPDARAFMLDVQAAILSGGLEALQKRREEALARLTETKIRRRAPGIDVQKDTLLREVGTALDLLKMVRIVVDAFPAVGARHPAWEIARFIHENESYTREAVEAGLRRRGKPEHATIQAKVLDKMDEKKPWWPEWAESIHQACIHYMKDLAKRDDAHPGANDPELLFNFIAMAEERARETLNRMTTTGSALLDYLAQIRLRVSLILTAQQEAAP